jgi:hypothetical protein
MDLGDTQTTGTLQDALSSALEQADVELAESG